VNPSSSLKTVLSIAGLDPSGGAGITADLKTFHQSGVFGLSALTAITVQNSFGVSSVTLIDPLTLRNQLTSLLSDYEVDAVKIGQIGSRENLKVILETFTDFPIGNDKWIVWDPVLKSTSGKILLEVDAYADFPHFIHSLHSLTNFVMTPNEEEFKIIKEQLTKNHLNLKNYNWLVTGSTFSHDNSVMTKDTLMTPSQTNVEFLSPKIITQNHHGTGCMLSAQLSSNLAQKIPLPESCQLAKNFVSKALKLGQNIKMGRGGYGPMNFWVP
jgi:hydroxymethylpyrimidine/phosphomethylpyrimidine kinase